MTIAGETTDPRILQAVQDASAALKQAGVSKVRIMDFGEEGPVEIIPNGGNRAEVNAALDAIKAKLQEEGYQAREVPAYRCAGSPMEVRVTRQGQSR